MESLGSTNDMLNVQKAINIIVSKATSLQEETILLKNSLGRICSKNIYSNINSPPENVSSMDGYALKYSNLQNINKIPIKIVGESAAGNPYIKKLNNYECVEIYTGAEVPKGANLILLQERVIISSNHIVSTSQNYKKDQWKH